MKKLFLLFVTMAVMMLCGITDAQDRGWASSIGWSPDGETIAVGGGKGVWFFDNEFNELGHVEIEASHYGLGLYLEWNAAGDLIALTYRNDEIRIVDVSQLEVINKINKIDIDGVLWTQVLWNPEGNLVIGGTLMGINQIWDALTGEEHFFFDRRAAKPEAVWFYTTLGFCWFTENTVVIVSEETIFVVDIVENRILQTFDGYFGVHGVVCNHDDQILSIEGWLFDLQTGTHTEIFNDYEGVDEFKGERPEYTVAAAWSPESGHFATSSEGCRLRVFDGQSGELAAEMPGSVYVLTPAIGFFADSIAWHPDGSRFAVVGQFGDIRVWDAKTYELLQRFDGFDLHPEAFRSYDAEQVSKLKCP